jgi:hypothetical protein
VGGSRLVGLGEVYVCLCGWVGGVPVAEIYDFFCEGAHLGLHVLVEPLCSGCVVEFSKEMEARGGYGCLAFPLWVAYACHVDVVMFGKALLGLSCHEGDWPDVDGTVACWGYVCLWLDWVVYEGSIVLQRVVPVAYPLCLEAGVSSLPHEGGKVLVHCICGAPGRWGVYVASVPLFNEGGVVDTTYRFPRVCPVD